jgi:ATP-binding cassette subfamily B (MDR/TAP) protein 1
LDGRDIRSLNLRWLRQQIAYVNQEPTLFNTTIFENIRYGLPEEGWNKKELGSLVITAAKTANAHDFIMALPDGYETEVGERGLQLSGGQRQRIAIARAVVSCPKILLLDEATSGLDALSESIVQEAVESVSKGRTTIVVAHHLSTIQRADNIIVVSDGSVVEQGKHDELVIQKGTYSSMVEMQRSSNKVQDQYHRKEFPNGTDGAIQGEYSTEWKPGGMESRVLGDSVETSGEVHSSSELTLRGIMKVINGLISEERWIIVVGLFCSTIVGLGTPVYVLVHVYSLHYSFET